jgi:hypothetical protein
MSYIIKTYNSDPSINFDKVQVDIYNSVVKEYTGNTVSEEFVKERIERDKFDHKGMMYAFSQDNKPLAYIRYYLYPSGSLYIGYPWSTPDCSPEIQEKLFEELKKYIKERYPDRKNARMGYTDNRIKPFHDFARKHNLEKNGWEVTFHIDVEEYSKMDFDDYIYREAKETDIEQLVQLAMEDFDFIGQEEYLSENQTRKYFTKEIFPNVISVFLLKGTEIIGVAGAWRNRPRDNSKITRIKYESMKKKYANERFYLYVALTKLLKEKGLTDEKIFIDKDRKEQDLIEKLRNSSAEEKGGTTSYNVIL